MTITKLFPSGAWEIADMVNGYRFRQRYFGFTKREAIAAFRQDRVREDDKTIVEQPVRRARP